VKTEEKKKLKLLKSEIKTMKKENKRLFSGLERGFGENKPKKPKNETPK